ncbi:hypothetical protein [Streptomyces hygroscopicus]|uniref:hypothetical protein n=1 Tax=Streptomyces hygroscopicus TaxID=1912 RepID=UPI0019601EC5|nr:hypothetical protein [Streptomyces sp. NBRC 109436]
MVRCFDEATGASKDYDFSRLGVSRELKEMLAKAFASRTAPGDRLTSLDAMNLAYRAAVQLADHVATLVGRPVLPEHLLPEHLDGVLESRSGFVSAARDLEHVKLLLAHAKGLSEAMRGKLGEQEPRRAEGQRKESLSRAEWKRVAEAARASLRTATVRIRSHREILRVWRAGELPDGGDFVVQRRMELLESVDRAGLAPVASAIKVLQRLHASELKRSTGRLSVSQLAVEGDVRRWQLTHRHTDLRDLFQDRVRQAEDSRGTHQKTVEERDDLRRRHTELQRYCSELEERVQAYATVINLMALEYEALTEQSSKSARVLPLPSRRTPST